MVMKKWIGLILACAVVLSCAVPAFAQETQQQKIVVSMSTIEDLMADYNLGIKTVVNNLKMARDSRDDYKDTEQEDYYQNQYEIAQAQYDEQVQQQVLAVKQQYIAFCADNAQLAEDQAKSESLNDKLTLYEEELGKGYISRKDYDEASDQAAQARNTLAAQDAKVTQGKKDLEKALNLPSGVSVSMEPLSDPDWDEIARIDYNADAISMYNKNAEIKAAAIRYDYLKDNDAGTGRQVDNARIEMEQTAVAQKSKFRQLYDTLMNAYRTYLQDSASLRRQESDFAAQQQMLQRGYASAQSVRDAQLKLQTARAGLAAEAGTLYADYLNYIHMKSGYAIAG